MPRPSGNFGYFTTPTFALDYFPTGCQFHDDATGKDFWRGYWPLLLAIGAAQLTQQVDVLMNGRAGGAASGAYVLLMRLAIADLILMMATGVVASTTVARARRDGDASVAVAELLGTAAVADSVAGRSAYFSILARRDGSPGRAMSRVSSARRDLFGIRSPRHYVFSTMPRPSLFMRWGAAARSCAGSWPRSPQRRR